MINVYVLLMLALPPPFNKVQNLVNTFKTADDCLIDQAKQEKVAEKANYRIVFSKCIARTIKK